jgi:hypothetical protein
MTEALSLGITTPSVPEQASQPEHGILPDHPLRQIGNVSLCDLIERTNLPRALTMTLDRYVEQQQGDGAEPSRFQSAP